MIKVENRGEARVSQGDIYRDVAFIEYVAEKEGNIELSKIIFPLVIVLTQDCDLQQDYTFRLRREQVAKGEIEPGLNFTDDKLLISVLVAPIYNAEFVFRGEHLDELNLKMETINKNKTPGTALMKNSNPRYHYLEFPENIPVSPSIIDFKHYFSVNVSYLVRKQNDRICKVSELYREDISQRFASFLSRIGLPNPE